MVGVKLSGFQPVVLHKYNLVLDGVPWTVRVAACRVGVQEWLAMWIRGIIRRVRRGSACTVRVAVCRLHMKEVSGMLPAGDADDTDNDDDERGQAKVCLDGACSSLQRAEGLRYSNVGEFKEGNYEKGLAEVRFDGACATLQGAG